jgi:hypothetical protein
LATVSAIASSTRTFTGNRPIFFSVARIRYNEVFRLIPP